MIPWLQSIRAKTSLLFLVLFSGIILPVNLIIYRTVRNVLEEANLREMTWEAEKLLNQITLDPLTVPLSANYDVRLLFRNPPVEQVLFESPGFPEFPPEGTYLDYYRIDTLEVVNVQKQRSGRGDLVLSLSRGNSALQSRLGEVRTYLFVISSISIGITGALVFLAAGWMLKPIRRISDSARRIQASQSMERIPLPRTRDESRSLAEAINSMLDRIERTIKTQTNFFASATHELKTPLAIMKAELQTGLENGKAHGLLEEVERLDHVISDFLLISQLKADNLVLRKRRESMDEVVYRALKKIKFLKEQYDASIQLIVPEPGTDLFANVDSDKVETVFTNLFENAIRYGHPKQLGVSVDSSKDTVAVQVSNPVAEPVEDAALLAREFNKSKALETGLGMGLWICDQIIKLHGGTLSLRQEGGAFIARVVLPKN